MDSFVKRSAIVVGMATAVILIFLAFKHFSDFILLLFGGVLWGVAINGLSQLLSRMVGLPYQLAMAATILLCLLLIGLSVLFFGPKIISGFEQLQTMIPQIIDRYDQWIAHYPLLDQLLERLPQENGQALSFSRVAGIFSTTLGVLTSIAFVLVTGIYFAVEPELYKKGLEHLVPKSYRQSTRKLMDKLGHVLRWWLLGRFLSLSIVGVCTWLGLMALDVPSAAALAFIAALLSFVPNIGPIMSLVPAIIVGWLQSPITALWVLVLYIGVQILESYFITPQIQQRNLGIPPGLLLSVQLFMGLLFGLLGLLLATPLTVVGLVLVRILYVDKVLNDPMRIP
ncbi:AI-2E family transporter [Marinobacteraceae bacterium S3BR75-40.1]